MKPDDDAMELDKWNRNDNMIRCWPLNLMWKELSKTFMYARSAKELWNDVECFRMSSEPSIY